MRRLTFEALDSRVVPAPLPKTQDPPNFLARMRGRGLKKGVWPLEPMFQENPGLVESCLGLPDGQVGTISFEKGFLSSPGGRAGRRGRCELPFLFPVTGSSTGNRVRLGAAFSGAGRHFLPSLCGKDEPPTPTPALNGEREEGPGDSESQTQPGTHQEESPKEGRCVDALLTETRGCIYTIWLPQEMVYLVQ